MPRLRMVARLRLLDIGAWPVLTAIVVGSFAARAVAGLAHVAPYYFADEEIYPALARGIAHHGRPVIRGAHASFPALLEPLTTAPVWLFSDGRTAVELVQVLHALEMSLAAVPLYLLARELRLPQPSSLLCACFGVLSPELFWSGFTLADPLSYPLALTAIWAAVRTLDRPTRRRQAIFLLTVGLAVAARTQYVALALAYAAAAVVLERGSVRGAVRRHSLLAAAAALAGVPVALSVARGGLGPYVAWLHPSVDPVAVAGSAILDVSALALAAGLVLAPGALLGLDLLLSKPRNRSEHAFAVVALVLTAVLVGLAALGPETRVQERYLIAVVPIVPVLFLLWVDRGAPRQPLAAALMSAVAGAAVALGLPARAATHSAVLWAFDWFSEKSHVPHVGYAVVVVLGAAGVALSLRARPAGLVAVAAAAMVGLSIASSLFDAANAAAVRRAELPAAADWVDAAGVGRVALLQTPGAGRGPSLQQLFWNRSVDRVFSMPGAAVLDSFAAPEVRIAHDGTLLVRGRPVAQPLLIPRRGALVRLAHASAIRRTSYFDLVRPGGAARVLFVLRGRPLGVASGRRAVITAWPPQAGSALVLELAARKRTRVTIRNGSTTIRVLARPGRTTTVALPLRARPLRTTVVPEAPVTLRSIAVRPPRGRPERPS